jgi:hypothetical protein
MKVLQTLSAFRRLVASGLPLESSDPAAESRGKKDNKKQKKGKDRKKDKKRKRHR